MWTLVFQRMAGPCLRSSSLRAMSTAVDKSALSNLRKRTGFSFMHCKIALEQFGNDIEQAEKWLQEQAQKEGWTKATKLQTRTMTQGLVSIYGDCRAATMIEVNCETDFVARNYKFIELASHLAQASHQFFLKQGSPLIFANKAMSESIMISDGKTLGDVVALGVGSIGENIVLRRAAHLKKENSSVTYYVHASGPELVGPNDCVLGKYGVLMSLKQEAICLEADQGCAYSGLSLDKVSNVLGQHIVGMNPRIIGEEENPFDDPNAICHELPPETDEEKSKVHEEDRLLFQNFLLDENIRVGDLLRENSVSIKSFVRFACGETIPED